MNFTVVKAIFKRDFVSYFSNPTGYVFICVFVVLSSIAAFWPPDFFGNNLANLDQLNRWMPFIMLAFIPAITMSIWAEERRQGTDELLLTLPASDRDVVIGKYLASVAIYTVSLLFSMFAIYLVFSWGLGSPDPGLFVGTYIGYWFIGLAMLSIGMVASFLTNNLTVGFTLGMVFNMPLALFGVADWIIKDPQLAQTFKRWSAVEQFSDFQRGVISLAGISYFVLIAVVMLYVSMVLISRRHWAGREDGEAMWAHYTLRAMALGAVLVGVNLVLAHQNALHVDVTSQKLNSLAGRTKELMKELRDDPDAKTIRIDAYVSPQVPAEYAAHKLNLLSTLSELSALGGGKIVVNVHEIENFSEAATLAEQTYGIEGRQVSTLNSGTRNREEIFMGVAITSGLDKVVIPFIDRGIPIEYELVRSICTVAQQERKKLGVVKTDVRLFGGFSMQGPSEESQLITELRKQYEVVEVDPSRPIENKYDVLLAIQPSSLGPEAMENFVQAVKSGIPTAIFEDPFPLPHFWGNVVGTAQPKLPAGGMMAMFGGGGPPEPKGDINQLWQLLGIEMHGDEIIWQDYNPEPKAGDFVDPEWIFIDDGLKAAGIEHPFSQEDPITAQDPNDPNSAGMQQILLLVSGSVKPEAKTKLKFTELAVTGTKSGTMNYRDYENSLRSRGAIAPRRALTQVPYIVAAHIEGTIPDDSDLFEKSKKSVTKDGEVDPADDPNKGAIKENHINVVVVSDIDWVAPVIFQLREMGQNEEMLIDWNFQNVPFVLNILDSLAGDDRFVDIRKRTRPHRILTKVEEATEEYRTKSLKEQQKFIADASQEIEAVRQNFRDKIAELENRTDLDPRMKAQVLEMQRIDFERQRDVQIARLEKQRDKQLKQSERDLALRVRGVQNFYKFWAVVLPPIPPILLAFFVYFHRRKAEQEGVDNRRLRYGRKTKDTDKDAA